MPRLQRMNFNYLLNKAYYEPPSHANFGACNKELIGRRFQAGAERVCLSDSGFCLGTVYPGLLIGIGNTHEAGVSDLDGEKKDGAEIKLGFTLDYVTGLPVIPGSTVKGVLRSAFSRHREYAAGLLGRSEAETAQIETAAFEEGTGKVVFFDAVPVKPGKGGCLFGLDNITPHSDPLKNPVPLTMLKILPKVVFLFRFGFERWKDTGGVTARELKAAFEKILITLGIGAKTNVGYGAMEKAEQEYYYYLEQMLSGSGNTSQAPTGEQSSAPVTEDEGMCQRRGCTERTKRSKKTGELYKYCYKHSGD